MKWIPLSERKPKPENKVLLFTIHKRIFVGFIMDGYIEESPKTCGCNGIHIHEVTHWMELPPLPKEEYPQFVMANMHQDCECEKCMPKKEKPVDPDWECMRKLFMTKGDDSQRIHAIYQFLKAKYDH